MTLGDELFAMADAMADVELFQNPNFLKVVEALRSAQKRGSEFEQRFTFEHFVHHNGVTKEMWAHPIATHPVTRPSVCDDVSSIIGTI